MTSKAKHYQVRIDLKEMRERGIELKEESIIHQEQLGKVCEIIRERIDDSVDYNPSKTGFKSINDVISIFARRGAGKTTFVKTLIDLVKNNKLANRETNAIKANELLCIDVIEPNQIYKKENFMVRFLASIEEKFNEEMTCPCKKEDKDLKKAKEKLYEALPVIDGIGNASMYADWDDTDYLADKNIQLAIKVKNLEQRFHSYIHKILDISERKALLFVLDDSDVNIERTFDILETIRLFFTSPQIIVIMTGDLSLYSMAVRRHYWKFFDKDYIEKDSPSTLSLDYKKREYFDMVRQLEAQYLQKLVKAEHRIVLNTVYDKYNQTKNEEKEEDKYSIEITLSNGGKFELHEIYQAILEKVKLVASGVRSDDFQIFINHLLKQPFRNQYRLLSAYDEYLLTHKEDNLSNNIVLSEALLKVFEVYVNQSSTDSKKLMDRSPIYSGWLMKFLIDNKIATIASHFLPTVDDDTLNNALFALCVWCEGQIQIDKSVAFDYLIRVSFVRQALLILNEDGKELEDFVGISRDIDVHKILGNIHAYVNAKIKSLANIKENQYPYAGSFTFPIAIFPSTRGEVEGYLVKLIQLESLSSQTSSTIIFSIHKLLSSLAELERECEIQKIDGNENDDNWLKAKLNDISQFHTYIEPDASKNEIEDSRIVTSNTIVNDSPHSSSDDNFLRDMRDWLNGIRQKWITPQSLDRIFTRMYYTMANIDSRSDYFNKNVGEIFSNYVLAFWNACIVEESIVKGGPKEIELGYDADIMEILIKNYYTFKQFLLENDDGGLSPKPILKDSFAMELIKCPLLRAYVNPLVILMIEKEGDITSEDYMCLREQKAIKSMNELLKETQNDITQVRARIDSLNAEIEKWNEIEAMEQNIEIMDAQLRSKNVAHSAKLKIVKRQKGTKSEINKLLNTTSSKKETLKENIEEERERIYSLHGKEKMLIQQIKQSKKNVGDQDRLMPDYCLDLDYEEEKKQIGYDEEEPLQIFIVKVLKYLAKRYLCCRCGQLYVKDEMMDEWMEFVRVFPPLMVEAAFFLDEDSCKNNDCQFFKERLVPIFGNSSLRRPQNRNLEQYVREEGGLSDLHVHMSGVAETDMLWWSQMKNVERWISSFFPSWEKENVKRQHEQLTDVPIKLGKTRIRRARELLQKVFTSMYDQLEDDLLFDSLPQLLYEHGEECPTLAKGAYFYWKLLTLMQNECKCEEIAPYCHEMILILGYVHSMMVQQSSQKGFDQFQLITKNDLRLRQEERRVQERFMQLGLDNDLQILKYVEVRFSPKANQYENRIIVSEIHKGFDKLAESVEDKGLERPQLRLIAHFIKKEDRKIRGYCRHCGLRRELMIKARNLWKLNKYLIAKRQRPIVGIDAAANEMHASPEVFSPAFRLLRGLMRKKEGVDLHFTYHAGEDFRHLLSGLRAMVEAVDFLEMEQGDRLGHCTAAGIDPELWLKRMGGKAKLSKGEWLDDLIMVYELIDDNKSTYPDLMLLLTKLHTEIEDLHSEIYGEVCSVGNMIKAWKCRKYDPDMLLRQKNCYYSAFLCECRAEVQKQSDYTKAREIYEKYHYDEQVKQRYDETIEVNFCEGPFTAVHLRHIQNLVLNKIAQKKLAIEVLFTSNLAISFYLHPEEHHLKRWLTKDAEGKFIVPPLVLGSDDPGIFMTNIYIEYARVMKYLENHGHDFRERLRLLNEFTQTSKFYKFDS